MEDKVRAALVDIQSADEPGPHDLDTMTPLLQKADEFYNLIQDYTPAEQATIISALAGKFIVHVETHYVTTNHDPMSLLMASIAHLAEGIRMDNKPH